MITVGSDVASPPKGWRLTLPETGVTLTASYASALRRRVNEHLRANGYPEMEQQAFEEAACRESGHGAPWCLGVAGPVHPPTTMDRVRRFLKTMTVLVRHREFVSKEEHARRMKICEGCPLRSIEGLGCHSCVDDLRDVERQVGPLPPGNVLTCTACGCLCFFKAWISNEVLDKAEVDEMPEYHEGCWRRGN